MCTPDLTVTSCVCRNFNLTGISLELITGLAKKATVRCVCLKLNWQIVTQHVTDWNILRQGRPFHRKLSCYCSKIADTVPLQAHVIGEQSAFVHCGFSEHWRYNGTLLFPCILVSFCLLRHRSSFHCVFTLGSHVLLLVVSGVSKKGAAFNLRAANQ
jgi:hypothetical protein